MFEAGCDLAYFEFLKFSSDLVLDLVLWRSDYLKDDISWSSASGGRKVGAAALAPTRLCGHATTMHGCRHCQPMTCDLLPCSPVAVHPWRAVAWPPMPHAGLLLHFLPVSKDTRQSLSQLPPPSLNDTCLPPRALAGPPLTSRVWATQYSTQTQFDYNSKSTHSSSRTRLDNII